MHRVRHLRAVVSRRRRSPRRVTRDCNCARGAGKRVCEDIGILASFDPVAIDQASVDLVNKACGRDLFEEMHPGCSYEVQLAHGEEIGLGSREYRLIEL